MFKEEVWKSGKQGEWCMMKGLMKVCTSGLAMWRGIGFPRECAGSCSVGRPWKRWIDTVKVFKEKRFGYQARKKNGPGYE